MMMLNDGRSELWQWDTGRKLTVDADCSQIHFSNKVFGRSVDVDVVDGIAIIPDILLQTDKELTAWAFVGTAENGYTKISMVFKVNKRNKPADYVFTPPEQTTLQELVERLAAIEESQDPDAIKNAVDDYLANNPIEIDETDPTVPEWAKKPTKPGYTALEVGALPADTVIPTIPDNVSAFRNDAGYLTEHQDLTGYATEQYVQGYAQPKGNYLTEVPKGYATEQFVKEQIAEAELGGEEVDLSGYALKSELPTKTSQLVNDSGYLNSVPEGYAKTEDIPTKPEDIGAQPSGNYLTEVPSGYATEEFVKNKIAEAELGGEEVDLSGYAKISDLPTKTSQLTNDSGFITKAPVESVNGKTGSVNLSASDVGARPDTWMPTAQEVGALPNTYVPPTQTAEQVGADPTGTAAKAVSEHNTDTAAHNDLRLEVEAINDRLTTFFDSDDQTLDELSEIVAYITSNKTLIDSITTNKVSVADIVNNLTTNAANRPLSAAQGVVLKGLIDGLSTGKLDANKLQDAINTALAQAKASGEFDGKDGSNGQPGADGISPTVAVSKSGKVTTISITDKNGKKTATINDGTDGQPGEDGKDGTSVTVSNVSESSADGGNNVVTFSDGKTITIKNGSKGASGKDGSDATVTATSIYNALGYTPLNKEEMFTIRETILPDYTNQITELEQNSMLTGDGSVKSGNQYVTVFIRVKKGDVIRIKEPSRNDIDTTVMVALYDANKTISANIGKTINSIATGTSYGAMTINGNTVTWDTSSISYYFWGDNFAWFRVTVSSADAIVTVNEELTESVKEQLILKPTVKVPEESLENASGGKPLVGKTVVCFGDSLFGVYRGADSAPAMIAEYTGATVHNVGFGGCRMSVHPSTGYAAFSMWALAKAIAENNWTTQDAQVASGSDYFAEQLALLKSIDFNGVDMVVIHYGTNDFKAGGGTTINNDSDHDDYNTLCGALRYSIEKLLGTYPKLQIFVSLPVYRFWTENNVTTYAEDYVWYEHTLPEFVEALRNTAAEYNIPVIDGFYGMGVNKHNASAYLSDGTHHNADGRKLFGEYIGGHLISKQSSGKSGMDVSAVNSLIASAIGNAIGGSY